MFVVNVHIELNKVDSVSVWDVSMRECSACINRRDIYVRVLGKETALGVNGIGQ